VNGGVNIDTTGYFDTIVIRRPTGFSGDANFFMGFRELQCWVNNTNILFDNASDLISNYALWTAPETSLGGLTEKVYDNNFVIPYDVIDTANSSDIALIITNIPLTAINTIQSLVLYSRTAGKQHSEGIAIELYNSTDLTEILASTNIITLKKEIYRFDFPSIDTYTGGFATDDSITQIISEGDIVIEDALFTPLNVDITGDVVVVGDLTAENLIVGSTNIITELTSLDTRLDTEEPKTTALQTLTAGHTTDIATNTADILTKQPLITTSTDLTCNSITASSSIVNSVDIGSGFSSLQTQVDALIEYITNVGFRVVRPNTDLFNSVSILEYNTIDFDTENGFSLVDFKYTISLAGTYLFTLQVFVPSSVEMTVDIVRERAGVDTILQQISNGTAVASNNSSYNITTISQVLTGDKIFGRVSSGSVRLSTSTSPANASFSGSRLSN
jgi:hypothetical protein